MDNELYTYDLSVVIPVYNAEEYVKECVESVLSNKRDKISFEIILIDDGSTDNSREICRELAAHNTEIVYIEKENSGVSDTRNIGINKANGRYIMMLDSDDYISNDTIINLIHFFDEHHDEVDLVTYPIYWDRNGKISQHFRYKASKYDKGTDVYDLDEYPYLNQSTVNVVFKNKLGKDVLYDTNMHLSEDQKFNTCILMRKRKIGFVKEAKYFYRRHGLGISQVGNNPLYCFDDIMTYNEWLLNYFNKNGVTPQYVQALVINTFKWRVDTDELLPYSYNDDKFIVAKQRIADILKKIDDEVIIKYGNLNNFVKIFFLKWKGQKLDCHVDENGFVIKTLSGEEIVKDNAIRCDIHRVRRKHNHISIFAVFTSPLLEMFDVNQYIIEGVKSDGEKFREVRKIKKSNVPSRGPKMNVASSYPFTFEFDPQMIKRFTFKIIVDGKELGFKPRYINFSGFIKKYQRNSIDFGEWTLSCGSREDFYYFKVNKKNPIKSAFRKANMFMHYPSKHRFGIEYYRHMASRKKDIWLYSDSPGVFDNAYYQFIHDIEKDDGVERYYVADLEVTDVSERFTAKQMNNVIQFKSKRHKELFLTCSKILVSYSSLSIYRPFKNVAWYSDLTQYQLVYLQHGILHASLQKLYSKEYTEIDKFVISSEFEKKNLIENYDYNEDELIMSGMPRMAYENIEKKATNKILFAPSWRQYLIGQLVDNKRVLMEKKFLASKYFTTINNFLHSERLARLLDENNLELDFKLHPIFSAYEDLFDKAQFCSNINIDSGSVDIGEYCMFITDFSSFQFDFVRFNRPIIYFLPDKEEVESGLHSYRQLDLKYEDAFGELCLTEEELLNEMKRVISNKFEVQKPYDSRMSNFFIDISNPCEELYRALIKE